ncbi:unnamed protein product, partial [marine sediment metagenome]
ATTIFSFIIFIEKYSVCGATGNKFDWVRQQDSWAGQRQEFVWRTRTANGTVVTINMP